MNRLGVITIGQSPRNDVMEEMLPYLGKDVKLLQIGALDDMTIEEINCIAPKDDDYVLISRMRDGSSVKFAEKHILGRLQKCIDKLEQFDVDVILFICTGIFPEIFTSRVPIIYPQKIMHSVVPYLTKSKKVGVIIPDESQILQTVKKWEALGLDAIVCSYSPYKKEDKEDAIASLRDADVDIIIMDCIGYTESIKNKFIDATGKPVILGRSLTAKVIGEMV